MSCLKTIYNFPPLIDITLCENGELRMLATMQGVAGTSVHNLHTRIRTYIYTCMYIYIYMRVYVHTH